MVERPGRVRPSSDKTFTQPGCADHWTATETSVNGTRVWTMELGCSADASPALSEDGLPWPLDQQASQSVAMTPNPGGYCSSLM